MNRLIILNKNNQLDYLTVCDLVKRILKCFNFNSEERFDKSELQIIVDNFIQQMHTSDTSLSCDDFKEQFKKIGPLN